MDNKVYIFGACRTAIGSFNGSLSSLSSAELASFTIKEAISRTGIDTDEVDHVIIGNVLQAGQGQNVARQAAIKAGLRETTTAETINVVCGSGLAAVINAARMIKCGDADIVVAGGTESMSNAPYSLDKARTGYRMGNGQLRDLMINDALWDSFNDCHMGITAENICEKWDISREELDEFALDSQLKAEKANNNGVFQEEIVPIEINIKKNTFMFDIDEYPRSGMTIEQLSKLKPAFKNDGKVTAGNSSGINDGAASVVLISENKAKRLGIIPQYEYIDGCLAGVDPSIMGIGPVASTNKLLSKLSLDINEIDLIEANEAFASQSIAVAKELNFSMDKVNINGGAIALGHPVGASGCRILVTLMHSLKRQNMSTGLATLCIGGGMGCSVIVKHL